MVNEAGRFPEVCKKSLQAIAADMKEAVPSRFWDQVTIPALQSMSPRQLEAAGRLVAPVICERPSDRYRPITWEEAFRLIADKLKSIDPNETFWYFSGRSSNEAAFLLQLFARLYGTNNVNNCSYYCHQASGVGLTSSIGSGTATIVLDDIEHADLVFVIGGNPASNHPRLMTTLKNIRRRGGKVIVINPVVESGLIRFRVPSDPLSLLFGSRIATQYIQPHIGGDLALLTGIAKRVRELGAHHVEYLTSHCENSEAWLDHLQAASWDDLEAKSGVDRTEIDRVARTYARATNAVFCWTMGITHHVHGVENVQAIANLALMRGMVGRPWAGLLPVRGHSNVQGIGSVGVTPQLRDAIFNNLQSQFGLCLPTTPGLDTLACIESCAEGRMKLGFCLGGNLFGSNPDARFASLALERLETIVYLSTTLNTGHAHGRASQTIVLPVLARDEEPQPTTQESMFNYVRLSDGGPRRHHGPRSEVEVIATIAQHVLPTGAIDWSSMRNTGTIRKAIGQVVPGWEQIGSIDQTRQEFQIRGRTFHEPRFPTPTGRARLHIHPLPELENDVHSLRLMTVRSEGQFNTVVYEEYDLYRGQERRDVILVHPDDLRRLGLADDQLVTVRSQTGRLSDIHVRAFDSIRSGSALMYFPEANVLIPRIADRKSRTPAFKNVAVWLEP
jgi:molybdopterin-dependent oxidoreductase alpha subunit